MNLSPLPSNISRTGGCTLTGALAVTTGIRDSVTIIHGPAGCAHHNFSLLHATLLDQDQVEIPKVLSSALSEQDIIFGGEGALLDSIKEAASMSPGIICVLSTCVTEMIGDDVRAVAGNTGLPVCVVPTAGFLGGTFEDGFSEALIALSDYEVSSSTAGTPPFPVPGAVNLIGEKNLESELDQNFREVKRLIGLLDLEVNIRFAHNIHSSEICHLSEGSLNLLREPALVRVGEHLRDAFGTPFIPSFPIGISGTLAFIRESASVSAMDSEPALERETETQRAMVEQFSGLSGARVKFSAIPGTRELHFAREIGQILGLVESLDGIPLSVPYPLPVGTSGIRHMLHRWRRELACPVA